MPIERQVPEEEEPVSPIAQLLSSPGLNVFNIVTIGSKTEIIPSTIVEGLKNTLINHPRFSSILVTSHCKQQGKAKWIPTKVKVEDHVIVPDIDPYIENPDEFLEDYTSNMALSPMDMSKPLWEFHILKLKTSYAESVVVARFHHSLGDGMSLMSLLLACTRKTSDPEALPTLVSRKESKTKYACWSLVAWLWLILRMMFHTCVEVINSIIFMCFARDMTMNDVLFGMTEAGLSRYLNQIYDLEATSTSRKSLDKICLHGLVVFNLRPNKNIEELANMMAKGSKCRWGNSLGYVFIPMRIKQDDDIFEYVRHAKTIMDRKKLSLEPIFSYGLLKSTMEIFGLKVLNTLMKRIFSRTTMIFSNVVGPTEEISFFGHRISYIAASTIGIPQALIISIQSYVDKLIINIGVDLDVIPDPHHLCDLIVEALGNMNSAAPRKVFHASEV